MNDKCRLAIRIPARLPVDAIAIADVEQTMCERLDEGIQLHRHEVT